MENRISYLDKYSQTTGATPGCVALANCYSWECFLEDSFTLILLLIHYVTWVAEHWFFLEFRDLRKQKIAFRFEWFLGYTSWSDFQFSFNIIEYYRTLQKEKGRVRPSCGKMHEHWTIQYRIMSWFWLTRERGEYHDVLIQYRIICLCSPARTWENFPDLPQLARSMHS